jgi:uncharacterized membrane protein YesL
LIWRGFRDLFERLLQFVSYSILWWLVLVTIVGGPPATVALFWICDPRRRVSTPEFAEAVAVFKSSVRRSWGITVFTVPIFAILFWNAFFFSGSNHPLVALVPLWILMLLIIYIFILYAFSMAATMESGTRNAFRGAMFVLISNPFRSLFLCIFLIVLGTIMAVTVLPMVLFGPALLAAIVNRFVLDALKIDLDDPDAPTIERQAERQRGINPDPTMLNRLRGSNKQKRRP